MFTRELDDVVSPATPVAVKLDCTNYTCLGDWDNIQCKNTGQCLGIELVCDGYDNCGDNTDENQELCKDRVNPYQFTSRNSFTAIWGLFNMFLGTIGNLMTIIAIPYGMRKRRWGLQNNWYTSNIFIVNLAFYDGLFCLIGMLDKIIFNLGYKWPFGSAFCSISTKVVPIISQASWYSLGWIAISTAFLTIGREKWNDFSTKSNAIIIMVCLLAFNILTSLPLLLDESHVSYYNDFTGVCEIKDLAILKGITPMFSAGWLRVPQKVAFITTCGMIFVSYALMWLKIRKSRKRLLAILQGNTKFMEKKVGKENSLRMTVFLVCVCYVIFVLPLIMSEFLFGVVDSNIIIGLYWTQYSINFVIYAGRRDAFQNAYMDIARMMLPKRFNQSNDLQHISKSSNQNKSHNVSQSLLSTTTKKISGQEYQSENIPLEGVAKVDNTQPEIVAQENKSTKHKKDKGPNSASTHRLYQIRRSILLWIRQNRKLFVACFLVFGSVTTIFWFMKVNKNINTKLIVIGGYDAFSDVQTSSVQVIDMEMTSVCDIRSVQLKEYIGTKTAKFTNLPEKLSGAKGTLLNGSPVICGGLTDDDNTITDKCYKMINQTTWDEIANMRLGRMDHGMSVVNDKLLVSGGWDTSGEYTDKVELLNVTSNTWTDGGNMNHSVAGHCIVTLNDNEVMSIGGVDKNCKSLNETWIYNLNTRIWRSGEPMLSSRFYHGCSWIKDANGNSFVMVAGGEVGNYCYDSCTYDRDNDAAISNTSEIFDPLSNMWSKFEDLPIKISSGQVIEDGRGGVLMIGGDATGDFSGSTPHIFHLPGKDGHWRRTFKTLDVPRADHVAMLIPETFINC